MKEGEIIPVIFDLIPAKPVQDKQNNAIRFKNVSGTSELACLVRIAGTMEDTDISPCVGITIC